MAAFYETKGWYKSKTIWVSIVGIVLAVLGLFGVTPAEVDANSTVEIIYGVISALAVVFRVKANKAIGTPTV